MKAGCWPHILLAVLVFACCFFAVVERIAAATGSPTPTPSATPSPTPPTQLPVRGIWTQFERRGASSGYWPGDVIHSFNNFDSVVGHTVADEVALQLDAMKSMGVNTITIELRSADQDANGSYPTCHVNPVLGFQWPQPTDQELANLRTAFDLFQSKGITVFLVLTDMHMEEQPPTNSAIWLGAILNVIKDHPALGLVMFNGDAHTLDSIGIQSCGVQAEPPLWLGPASYAGRFVSWAIGYGLSLGVPASKLSSEAVVGSYNVESSAARDANTAGNHLWSPIAVLKTIFDNNAVATAQRTYALSFYEHRKCSDATPYDPPCTDEDADTWAKDTAAYITSVVGWENGAHVVAGEMGNMTPVDPTWSTKQAVESLLRIFAQYGFDGGSFWRWTSFTNSEDSDATLAAPIKLRGTSFTYTAAKDVLQCYYTGACALPPRLSAPPPTPTPTPGVVGNVSTRLPVGTGDNVLIEGFIVQGPAGSTKKIMVRAIGPSLAPFGIADALANPTLEIHDANNVIVATNDNWKTTQTGGLITGDQSAEIRASGLAPSNDLESAIIANLAPGSYTAVVLGFGNTTGTGVVDAYDLSPSSPAKLANIATRGLIQPGDKLMIAGFIVQNTPVQAVVRAIGPSLTAFGIANALSDTTVQLRDQNGTVVVQNDDWKVRTDGSSQQAELEATGLQPTNDLEAAFVTTLLPGQYTAQVRGKPETTGIGVVQVYFLQ